MTSDDRAPPARRFLLLQGPPSPFFARLGKALARRGHLVRRIHFNAGDWLFGPFSSACHYRGSIAPWPEFLRARLDEWRITDLVLFGDCRVLHRIAIDIARERGIAIHVFEKGYERPGWIALERGGVNGYSPLLRDPKRLLAAANVLAAATRRLAEAPKLG
jgi:capsular polysaccharide export protein